MKKNRSDLEKKFLDEINSALPKNVDWKKGATDYLSNYIKSEGEGAHIFHLLKPFITGANLNTFYEEMYKLLNLLQILNLPKGSAIMDVGCGPGWISHYLGKLGYFVVGIDISEELIDIAKKRLSNDISPFPGQHFPVKFIVHDIEMHPVDEKLLFDAAVFESTLHHFYNPIAALRNVSKNLKSEGVIAVLEGFAPKYSSKEHYDLLKVMNKYQTLERPYTKEQFESLFNLAGFQHFTFLYPVSGIKKLSDNEKNEYRRFYVDGPDFNYIIASQSPEPISKIGKNTSDIERENPFSALISIVNFPDTVQAGNLLAVAIKVSNISKSTWQNYGYTSLFSYNLSYHWYDPDGNVLIYDGIRTPLPNTVSPRTEIILSAKVKAPSQPGKYVIEFDIVREHISWFAQQGSKPTSVSVEVMDKLI